MQLPMRQIFQEMAAQKLRLGLTILAVAWATLCIGVMLSVGEGIRQGVISTTERGNGQLIYVTGGIATVSNSQFFQGKALKLGEDDADVIAALPNVERALPTSNWQDKLKTDTQMSWTEPFAVRPEYASLAGLEVLPGGRWLNPKDENEQRNVIVLGYLTAVELFNEYEEMNWFASVELNTDPVGKTVKVGARTFTVVGVLAKNSANVERGDSINYAAFVPLNTWKRFHPNEPVQAINVQPKKSADRVQLASVIRQVLVRKHGASLLDEQVVQVDDMYLNQKTMRQFLIGLQSFLGLVGLITLLVAGIGIANIMYAMVKGSTRDIGVRMAVGATPLAIRMHYLTQSIMTMLMGGGLGLLLTFGVVTLFRVLELEGNALYESLGKPVPELSIVVVTVVVTALMVIGVLAAWLPANRAASVSPLEALHSE
ncbi:Putative ABC transporter, permease component [Vibrio nigripulchritudo SOn1]|uniref:ABC transporter, permease component n=1 Tax=Vibrio nigripulchritudo SOn1 TaxID=1238450 RepID=A0AAV2VVI2_9VIBR|nr:ABC transporter permease [Vibrio nigripulchritudo]CCO48630.1 Putative ABC transporter, permease component [Vibrio nigripulchritudo SOn1]